MAYGTITSWQIEGEKGEAVTNFFFSFFIFLFFQILFSCAPKSLLTVFVAMELKDPCSFEGKIWQI